MPISLYQFSICALLNACSVISYNWYDSIEKNERVWVCFETARVQQYKDCGLTVGLAEESLPSMRHSRIAENTGSIALA